MGYDLLHESRVLLTESFEEHYHGALHIGLQCGLGQSKAEYVHGHRNNTFTGQLAEFKTNVSLRSPL